MSATLQLFRGEPSYNVAALLAAAFDGGTFAGSSTQVTLTYGNIVVTFTGSGLSHNGARVLQGGQISTIVVAQGGVNLAQASGYAAPIGYQRVQAVIDFFNTVASPSQQQVLDALGGLLFSEETFFQGSNENDTLFGARFFHTDLHGGAGNDIFISSGGETWMVGGSGADNFVGGQDFDQIAYIEEKPAGDGTGINFNWNTGVATDSFGHTDTFDAAINGVHGTHDADTLIGNDNRNTFSGYSGADYIDGAGGNDRVRYDREFGEGGPSVGVTVNLQAGTATDSFGYTDTVLNVEDVEGTRFNDTITGSDAENYLSGGAGADTISGGLGSDFINGGQGNDIVHGGGASGADGYDNLEYLEAENAVTVTKTSRTTGTATGVWAGTDTFDGIEIVVGSSHDDVFNGSSEDDDFTGNAGNDTFNGGGGNDTVVYEKERTGNGVWVNLATGVAEDAFGDTDTLNSIENIVGTQENDFIQGNAADNVLDGHDGNDELLGGGGADVLLGGWGYDNLVGGAGNDVINGQNSGGDEDQVDYWREQNGGGLGVNVNFTTGIGTDTYGNTDTLIELGEATGTMSSDTFTGGDGYNGFRGFGGADTFINSPNGDGHVWVYYGNDDNHGGMQAVIVNLSDQALVGIGAEAGFAPTNIAANSAKDGFGSIDSLVNIHSIRGTALADWVRGSEDEDHFQMQAGDDYIDGAGGRDLTDYSHDIDEGAPDRGVVVNLSGTALVDIDIGLPEGPVDVGAHRALDGFGDTDTLVNIERVRGTYFDDWLVGADGQRNFLDGSDGDDVIVGGNHDDDLQGGDGDDTIYAADSGPNGYGDYIMAGSGNNTIIASAVYGPGGWRDGHDLSFEDIQSGVTASLVAGLAYADNMTTTFSEVHLLIGSGYDDSLTGGVAAFDDFESYTGNAGDDFIDGGSGWDQVDYRNEVENGYRGENGDYIRGSQGVVVDLGAGTATDSFGDTDTLVDIEQVRGTDFDDWIAGADGQHNSLQGRGGNDVLVGGDRDDDLDGGDGDDTIYAVDNGPMVYGDYIRVGSGNNTIIASAVYGPSGNRDGHDLSFDDIQSGVTASLVTGFASASGMTVTFSEVHFLIGSGHADSLTGGVADFNDFEGFTGNAGDDIIDGGAGRDVVDYRNEVEGGYRDEDGNDVRGFQGVVVDLGAGTATDSFGDTDTLISIEGVRGTRFADSIVGHSGSNDFIGYAGDDLLDGAGGTNRVRYDNDSDQGGMGGVWVDLQGGTATDGFGDTDTLLRIQDVVGTNSNDTIIGNGEANRLEGRDGNDALTGGGGADVLVGGDGDDWLAGGTGKDHYYGGAGADTFVFTAMADSSNSAYRDVITDFEMIDRIDLTGIDANSTLAGLQGFTFTGLSAGNAVNQGELKLQQWNGITYLIGNAGTDTVADFQVEITGLHNLNTDNFIGLGRAVLTGTASGDMLKGTDGADTLNGQGGADLIIGGLGADQLTGGSGSDLFMLTSIGDSMVGANRDVISDFEAIDRIGLPDIDANSSLGGTQKWAFAGLRGDDTNVLQGQIEYYYSGGNTFIIGNAGPDNVADFQIQLTGIKTITAENFIGAEKLSEHINFGGGAGDDVLTVAANGAVHYRDAVQTTPVQLAGPSTQTVLAIGNFGGDLTDDFVYRTTGGWYGLINATGGNTNIGYRNGMTVEAVGDYDGDGRDDILFQNTSSGWLSYVRGGDLANVNIGSRAGSTLMATGDFNGDGREDLLFRNDSSGWLSYARGGDLANVNVGYRAGQSIKAVADFDGDGRDDVLFQSTSSGWISYAKAGNGANVDIGNRNGQTLLGVGDFNGDGAMDLLFRSTSGWMSYTRGDTGTTINIGTIANNTVVGIGDYDADGQSDLLLQHVTSGDLSYRPGAAPSGSVALGAGLGLEVIADLGTGMGDDMLIA